MGKKSKNGSSKKEVVVFEIESDQELNKLSSFVKQAIAERKIDHIRAQREMMRSQVAELQEQVDQIKREVVQPQSKVTRVADIFLKAMIAISVLNILFIAAVAFRSYNH